MPKPETTWESAGRRDYVDLHSHWLAQYVIRHKPLLTVVIAYFRLRNKVMGW